MPIEIDELTVDVEDSRPESARAAATPAVPLEPLLRLVQAALADEEARRQRLTAD
jgi:hypothetical protein